MPRFNIAPGQDVAAVRLGDDGSRQLCALRWGLIPSWAKDPSIGNRLINARGETVAEKPAFRRAFEHRRCLVPADGYYEWKTIGKGLGKQPYFIRLRDDEPFALAGLWDRWQDPSGVAGETCTIVTTAANELTAPIHDRMPVIVAPDDYAVWLGPGRLEADAWERMARPYPGERMTMYPVSTRVNQPRNDSAACVEPVDMSPEADREPDRLF
jgi:putative SOS response-associated peptidase YedK